VLFMSGYAQPVLDAHGAFSDDIDLLEKPFPAAALLARVRQATDTSAQDSADSADSADGTAGPDEAAGPDAAADADSPSADGPHARASRAGRARTKGGRVRPG
jgi:hypothetical protein